MEKFPYVVVPQVIVHYGAAAQKEENEKHFPPDFYNFYLQILDVISPKENKEITMNNDYKI